jgi:hypothetical protein
MLVRVLFLTAATTAVATAQSPGRPPISNGTVVERAAAPDLSRVIDEIAASAEPQWIAFAAPAVDGEHMMCGDSMGRYDGYRLEPGSGPAGATRTQPSGPIPLEPARMLAIFARVAGGQVERIRTFTAACPVDAGGRTVHWLTSVRPADGVAWLSRLAGSDTRRLADGAMTALAMHADPGALDWLLTAARTADSPRVRGQALFWLSQRAGQRAVGAISEALDRDPDTDVKKRAVFALSQLPSDEGVPRLIDVARSHSNKAVRKQAFFWLGQSKDPRALAFFREVLAK